MKKINIVCLSLLVASPLGLYAQTEEEEAAKAVAAVTVHRKAKKQEPTRTISGKVLAEAGNEPLAGVLIQSVAGEGYSTLSNEDGTFKLEVPLYSSALRVTIPGYNGIRVGLNKSGQLRDIVLQSDAVRPLYTDDDNITNVVSTGSLEFSPARNIKSEVVDQLGDQPADIPIQSGVGDIRLGDGGGVGADENGGKAQLVVG